MSAPMPSPAPAHGGKNADKQWIVFYHESVRLTAEKVKACMPDQIVLSELVWRHFPDGFPDLQIKQDDVAQLESYHGTVLMLSFHSPAVIFEQLCLLYTLPRLRARNLRVILPWFSTGTMDRVETFGQVATATSLAKMISACPIGPSGPATILLYEIHALQEEFYFSDNVLVELRSATWLIKEVIEKLCRENPKEQVVVAFPDEGSHKQFKAKFMEYPHIICSKIRDGDKRIMAIKEGDPSGRHVIIIDDLVQTGATLLSCAKLLHEKGASKVSCSVTHGVFPNESYLKFVDNPYIHKFWITDSVPNIAATLQGWSPFEILSLAPLHARYLQGTLPRDLPLARL